VDGPWLFPDCLRSATSFGNSRGPPHLQQKTAQRWHLNFKEVSEKLTVMTSPVRGLIVMSAIFSVIVVEIHFTSCGCRSGTLNLAFATGARRVHPTFISLRATMELYKKEEVYPW
jgi:hypothetical protein